MLLKNKIEKIFNDYPFSFMQDFATLVNVLKNELIEIDQLIDFIEKKKGEIRVEVPKEIEKSCPLCFAPMNLLPLNFNPATLTGDDSQSVWLCSNQECMNTIYNKETIAELQAAKKGGT